VSSYRDDFREGSRETLWSLPRVLGLAFVVILAVYLLMVVVTPLTIGFGWYRGEANLRGFGATKATYAEAYDDVNALTADAQNICTAKQALAFAKESRDQNVIDQRSTQLFVYTTAFNALRGRYDAYMEDHFRGGVNRPKSLPLPYPTLSVKLKSVGC
jgi:hypothetical protein